MFTLPQNNFKEENLDFLCTSNNTLIVGDFNSKSRLWGSNTTNSKGKKIENFLDKNKLVCINNKQGTRINNDNSLSHIDLVLCSPNLSTLLDVQVHDDRWGSDHFPILVESIISQVNVKSDKVPAYNFKKAGWPLFKLSVE